MMKKYNDRKIGKNKISNRYVVRFDAKTFKVYDTRMQRFIEQWPLTEQQANDLSDRLNVQAANLVY